MITHSHPPIPASDLILDPPPAAAGVVHLGQSLEGWVVKAASSGMRLFGDVGWDSTQQWSTDTLEQLQHLHAFLPNSVEAMAYTRTDDPRAALHRLADRVPVVVITCGGQGSIAIDSSSGEEEWVPSLPVNALDATGAGDVFAAAFVLGTLRGWPLRHRLAFANLCAALSVQQVGGSLAAPGWGDLSDWQQGIQQQSASGSQAAIDLAQRYAFLADVLPAQPVREVRRAAATIARSSDA